MTARGGRDGVYQLRVTLREVTPPVWRRIQVPGGTTLHRLHRTLQAVMGWEDYHLYVFEIGEVTYSDPSPEWDIPMENAERTRLADVVSGEGAVFVYEYDLGDGWRHQLRVEALLPREAGVRYPVCLDGERACPPEDCGGPPGYEGFLEAIADPEHEEHERLLEWAGGAFDSEAFDVGETNRALAQRGLRRR